MLPVDTSELVAVRALQPAIDKRQGELEALYWQRWNAQKAQEAEQKRLADERIQQEREARDAEKAAWIREHGSSHLKKCLDMGYDCQRLYIIERAALEHLGYTVDFNDAATWKDRSMPSEAALDEAARVNGMVVWLTSMPSAEIQKSSLQWSGDDIYAEDITPCEAVVIRNFQGRYDLVKIMGA